ncbi:MAG: hypothetical protein KC435_12870 [Thermomicrobiales bacterium]|nr:hypothetical protein [Thermomicrobiales bacterium]
MHTMRSFWRILVMTLAFTLVLTAPAAALTYAPSDPVQDWDGDGIPNDIDPDDDNDGVRDFDDPAPADASIPGTSSSTNNPNDPTQDSDGDGLANDLDPDSGTTTGSSGGGNNTSTNTGSSSGSVPVVRGLPVTGAGLAGGYGLELLLLSGLVLMAVGSFAVRCRER